MNEDGYASLVSFACPYCGGDVVEVIFVPSSSTVKRDEHCFSTEGETDIICGRCTQSYNLIVRNTTGRVFAQVRGFPKTPVKCSGSYHPDELDKMGGIWEVPDTPSNNLVDALTDIEEVINTKDAIFYVKTLSRMAFIQQFAALEAYLSDTLTKQVLDNPTTLNRAIAGVRDLKEIKFTLAQIAANSDILKTTVAGILRKILYHNFIKIDTIWNVALGFSIFPNSEVKSRLLRSEPIRHDCVHRNGRDKDGNESADVDFDFVLQMNEDLHALLNHIEDTLHPMDFEEDET